MRLPTTAWMFIGLFIGFLLVAAVIVPSLYSSGAGTGSNNPGGSSTNSSGGNGVITPTCGDVSHYYKIEGEIRLYVDNQGNPYAQFVYVNVLQYTPSRIPNIDLPALSWTTADYRVKVRYIAPDGSVKTEDVWEGSVDYGDYKTVSFSIEIGHCNGGTLQLVVERMDGTNYITDTYNAMYKG